MVTQSRLRSIAATTVLVATLLGCSPEVMTYRVHYDSNGGTGSPPVDTTAYIPGATVTIADQGALARTGHGFDGWNSDIDGGGVQYPIGSTLTIGSSDVTLFAQWRPAATIAVGGDHSTALLGNGTLYAWGFNRNGQVGDGSKEDRNIAVQVPRFPPEGTAITALSVGFGQHTMALLSDNTLHAWGQNEYGEFGDGTTDERITPTRVPNFPPEDTAIAGIASGAYYSLALLSNGDLYAWGQNQEGQFGDGTTSEGNPTPTLVPNFPPATTAIVSIAAGFRHNVALLDDGTLYAWGRNNGGQVGDGTFETKSVPTLVPDFPPESAAIAAISTGGFHTVALLDDGTLYAWGDNDSGQLGDGSFDDRELPTSVPDFPPGGTTITTVATGGHHTLALLSDGSLYAWGEGFHGQLGDGTMEARSTPAIIPDFPPEGTAITSIAAGSNHSAALLDDGTIYTWGRNVSGQLADGTFTDRGTPVPVIGVLRVAGTAP